MNKLHRQHIVGFRRSVFFFAYEQDEKSRSVLLKIIANNFLDKINASERHFALLPLIHSESISDHEKAYELLEKYLKNHSDLKK